MTLSETIVLNRPCYCHTLEVATVDELKSTLEDAFETFVNEGWNEDEVSEFLSSINVVYFNDEGENETDENEVYEFDVNEFLTTL